MEFYEFMTTENLLKSTFLAENREALGLLAEAMPLAANGFLLAARGCVANDGMRPPTFTVGGNGTAGLYDTLYQSVLEPTDANLDILRRTFGENNGPQTHTISRYVAAMTEALVYEALTDGNHLSQDDCLNCLSTRIPTAIDRLHDMMRAISGPRPGSERFFAVSFLACICKTVSRHTYDLEIYAAGDYVLYMLDERGLSPLWTATSDMLTGYEGGRVEGHSVRVVHETPFALLLLSRNACDPPPAEKQSIEARQGALWKHRMRIEEQIVRLISSGMDLADFADRAERFYEAHPVGNESIQGAMTVIGGTYESIRSMCHERVADMEQLLSLFPSGYEPGEVRASVSPQEAEKTFILNAFNEKHGLLEKTKAALAAHAKQCLHGGLEASPEAYGEDGVRRLTYEDVSSLFEAYDKENREDRAEISQNDRMMRELLSEHWLSLRPVLCDAPVLPEARPVYDACVRLSQKISRLIAHRQKRMAHMRQMLLDSLHILQLQEKDWICARGGDDSTAAWLANLETNLPSMAGEMSCDWARVSDLLRSLQSAYTQEREKLFCADAVSLNGPWHGIYLAMLNGTLEDVKWQTYGDAIAEKQPIFSDLWKKLSDLSCRNRRLYRRIDGRAAERRMLRTLSESENWQINCMVGALRGDTAWGECLQMIDRSFGNEYRIFMRHVQEEKELLFRQAEAFAAYKEMYEAYES